MKSVTPSSRDAGRSGSRPRRRAAARSAASASGRARLGKKNTSSADQRDGGDDGDDRAAVLEEAERDAACCATLTSSTPGKIGSRVAALDARRARAPWWPGRAAITGGDQRRRPGAVGAHPGGSTPTTIAADDLQHEDRDDRAEVERADAQPEPAEDAQVGLGAVAQEVQDRVRDQREYGTRTPSENTNCDDDPGDDDQHVDEEQRGDEVGDLARRSRRRPASLRTPPRRPSRRRTRARTPLALERGEAARGRPARRGDAAPQRQRVLSCASSSAAPAIVAVHELGRRRRGQPVLDRRVDPRLGHQRHVGRADAATPAAAIAISAPGRSTTVPRRSSSSRTTSSSSVVVAAITQTPGASATGVLGSTRATGGAGVARRAASSTRGARRAARRPLRARGRPRRPPASSCAGLCASTTRSARCGQLGVGARAPRRRARRPAPRPGRSRSR